jgi:catechol 2,3-dioxygenase-like lactoylglutathione lyase family enzyme
MSVRLDHTIVPSRRPEVSAVLLSRLLGVGQPVPFGHFLTVALDNDVTLDYDRAAEVHPQHYAFLVDDADFDPIFERVQAEGITYYADPGHSRPGEVNRRDGGRGFYFADPDGHNLEVLTRPYGSGSGP